MPDEKGKTGAAILAALEKLQGEVTELRKENSQLRAMLDAKKAIEDDDDDYL